MARVELAEVSKEGDHSDPEGIQTLSRPQGYPH